MSAVFVSSCRSPISVLGSFVSCRQLLPGLPTEHRESVIPDIAMADIRDLDLELLVVFRVPILYE